MDLVQDNLNFKKNLLLTEEEESSRLMDLVQDNLNFKKNLRQKNIFHMASKPDRMVVEFRNLKAQTNVFVLEFGKHDPYNAVVGRVAQKLCVDFRKIRLTRHCCPSDEPMSDHIEFLFAGCLLDVVMISKKLCNVLYYEVLDVPQVDLAHWKVLYVSYGGHPHEKIRVVLPRHSRIEDLLKDIAKVKLTNPNAELRLLGIYNYKICKVFHVEEKIEDIPEKANLRVEEVLEEKNLDCGHHVIRAYHFTKMDTGRIVEFGDPFLFVIREDETLAEVKVRIQEKLSLENEEFSEWKFTLLGLGGRLQYLKDTDVVYNCFEDKDVLVQYFGLEHQRVEYDDEDDLGILNEICVIKLPRRRQPL